MIKIVGLLIIALMWSCSKTEDSSSEAKATGYKKPATSKVVEASASAPKLLPDFRFTYPFDIKNFSKEEAKKHLELMFDNDQGIREILHQAVDSFGINSPELGKAIKNMNKTDSLNQIILAFILHKYGWPTQHEYGVKATEAAFYVTIHAPLHYKKKYLSLLEERAQQKTINLKHYQVIYDRIQINEGKKQLYQTHKWSNGQLLLNLDTNNNNTRITQQIE